MQQQFPLVLSPTRRERLRAVTAGIEIKGVQLRNSITPDMNEEVAAKRKEIMLDVTNENLRSLGAGLWLVRTQAGYRKILKQQWVDNEMTERSTPTNYPKAYPAVVRFHHRSYGDYLTCSWETLNAYRERLQRQLTDIEGE